MHHDVEAQPLARLLKSREYDVVIAQVTEAGWREHDLHHISGSQ